MYKKTILTFEGMFYGGMCLKRNFRLQIGKEVLCNDQEARGFDAETFRPAVLKSLAKYFFMRIIQKKKKEIGVIVGSKFKLNFVIK